MILYTFCHSCKNDISIRSMANTRPELERDKGETFEVRCKKCRTRNQVHVDQVKAKPGKIVIALGVVLGIFVAVIFWRFYWAIGTLSGIIPIIIWRQEMAAAYAFNSYRRR